MFIWAENRGAEIMLSVKHVSNYRKTSHSLIDKNLYQMYGYYIYMHALYENTVFVLVYPPELLYLLSVLLSPKSLMMFTHIYCCDEENLFHHFWHGLTDCTFVVCVCCLCHLANLQGKVYSHRQMRNPGMECINALVSKRNNFFCNV